MDAPNPITDGKVVALHYRLCLADGTEVANTEGDEPVEYLHGADDVVPGLESELEGKTVGDKIDVVIAPADGYGDYDEEALDTVPRDAFPDDLDLQVGDQLTAETEDGEITPMQVLAIDGDTIKVDLNHPLAGKALHYNVEVVDVRMATDDEIAAGRV